MKTIIALVLFAAAAMAQTTRSVTLNWTDTRNPAGTTYNVFKAPAACSANPTNFVRLASGIAVKTYLDSGVPVGSYCYYVTAVYNAMESGPSPQAVAAVGPFSPDGLTVTVSVTVNVMTTGAQPQQ